MAKPGIGVEDFARAIDEFFDEMLISRWRSAPARGEFERSQVLERSDRYEVTIAMPGTDPDQIEVDVNGQRMTVRAPAGARGRIENTFSFAMPIEQESVAARWSGDTLIVVVPKQKPKRIKVNEP